MRTKVQNLKVLAQAYIEANCRGRSNGISKNKLCAALSVPLVQEKRLREALQLLAMSHPLGSSVEHGYFWCIDAEDFAVARDHAGHYAFPSMRRWEAKRRQQKAHLRNQQVQAVQGSLFEGGA